MFGIGLLAGMSLSGAFLFMIIVQAICMTIGAILGATLGPDGIGGIGIVLHIIILIICGINFFIVPNVEDRYKPTTVIAGSYDGQPPFTEGNIKNIPVGRPYYIRVETEVQVNGWLRRLTMKNVIPVSIEFSNANIADLGIDADSIAIPIEPVYINNKIVYYFDVIARSKPEKRQITFKVISRGTGEQRVLVSYEKPVSKNISNYFRTLEYVH